MLGLGKRLDVALSGTKNKTENNNNNNGGTNRDCSAWNDPRWLGTEELKS